MTSSSDVNQMKYDGQSDGSDEVGRGSARRWLEPFYCSRDVLAIKMFYFFYFAMFGVFYPYSSVFLKQHGIGALEIGLISSVRPLIGLLSAPLFGAVADHFRIRRLALIVTLIAGFAFLSGLFAVREPERRGECPESFEPFLSHSNVHAALHRDLAADAGDDFNVSFIIRAIDGALSSSSTVKRNFPTAASFQSQVGISGSFVHSPLTSASERKFEPSVDPNGDTSNSSLVSEEDQTVLRADLGWLYETTSRYHVFIICFVIICCAEIFQAPTTAMSDAATLQILGRERLHEYGAQRAWGPVGLAVRLVHIQYTAGRCITNTLLRL